MDAVTASLVGTIAGKLQLEAEDVDSLGFIDRVEPCMEKGDWLPWVKVHCTDGKTYLVSVTVIASPAGFEVT